MAPTPAQYAAANTAMDHLVKANPKLAQKLVADFKASHQKYSAAVQADMFAVRGAIGAGDADALDVIYKGEVKWGPTTGPASIPVNTNLQTAKIPGIGVDVPGFLGALTNSNTWLRVVEVTLGIVLVVVGLVKLAPPGVAKNVKSVGKVAALL